MRLAFLRDLPACVAELPRRVLRKIPALSRAVAAAGATTAELLFPRTCAACGRPMGEDSAGLHLCWDCRGRIEYQGGRIFCDRCGRSFEGVLPMPFLCGACRARPPSYDAARSAAHFRDPVRTLLLDFKYHGATWLCTDLADLLEACVRTHFPEASFEAVCPVPLHPRRRRERGYNQAELLARALSRRLGVPCFPDALRRRRYTGTQTRLDAARRRANLRDAFAPNPVTGPWLEGRSLLLVDDVMTTGTTVGEAARALKAGGVRAVRVVTVARD